MNFFFGHFPLHEFFFGHFPLHEFFFGFSPPPPHHFSNGPSLIHSPPQSPRYPFPAEPFSRYLFPVPLEKGNAGSGNENAPNTSGDSIISRDVSVFGKLPFFAVHTKTIDLRFLKSPLRRAFLENLRFFFLFRFRSF